MIKPIKHIHDSGAYKYADMVLSGKIPVGLLLIDACNRFMNDLERDDLFFDLEVARKVVNYPKLLKHWKGAKVGLPIDLEPHQEFYFQQMFGWKRKETNLRRFTRSFKEIARKNGKTTELAIQGLFHCQIDLNSGPQFYVGATKEDQARITLLDAWNILPNKWITEGKFKKYGTGKYPNLIMYPENKGSLNTIGRDSKRSDGLDVSFAGIDEYHEHPDTSIRDILASAQGNRIEPIESIITTAGYNINGPCYRKSREVGIKILKGVVEDDNQLVIINEIDNWDEWEDEEQWICANPMMSSSQSLKKDLKDQFVRAKNEGGSTEVTFKTKHLNMWVNSPLTWIPHEVIKKNNHGVTEEELLGKECYGGLDLSAGTDLNAYILFFPNVRDGIHAVKSYFWIPEEKLGESKEADYNAWKQYLGIFDGNNVEYHKIARTMLDSLEKYDIKSWGADPYRLIGPAETIVNEGQGDLIMKVTQGKNLAVATDFVDVAASQKQFDFMDNPVMMWNFSNVRLGQTANGHRYPAKDKSQNKIDGVSALCTAIHEYLRIKADPPKEVGFVGVEMPEW